MKNGSELKNAFGSNIRFRRIHMGFSQENLAEQTGVSKNTISDIETGEKFARPDTIVKLALALNTEAYELMKPEGMLPERPIDIALKVHMHIMEAYDMAGKNYLKQLMKEQNLT